MSRRVEQWEWEPPERPCTCGALRRRGIPRCPKCIARSRRGRTPRHLGHRH
jgi:hypothetical protein